jgi:polyphenol oxidase
MSRYDLELTTENGYHTLASPKLLRERSMLICFTTRAGGVSENEYDSLNLAFHVGDDPEAVGENRFRIMRHLGLEPGRLVTGVQTHSANVAEVFEADAGRGALAYATALPDTDALITATPNLPIAVLTADCVPVILADVEGRIMAVVHAGYKGLYYGIVSQAARMIIGAGAGGIGDIIAFVGPSIGPCHYEVDHERAALFGAENVLDKEGKLFLDLPGAVKSELTGAGILEDNIIVSGLCTYDRPDLFYSYRRDGDTGRQAAIAAVLGE